MTTFRFYRLSLFDGAFSGTNDEALAKSFSLSEDEFIVDTQTNEFLHADGTRIQVPEFHRDWPEATK